MGLRGVMMAPLQMSSGLFVGVSSLLWSRNMRRFESLNLWVDSCYQKRDACDLTTCATKTCTVGRHPFGEGKVETGDRTTSCWLRGAATWGQSIRCAITLFFVAQYYHVTGLFIRTCTE